MSTSQDTSRGASRTTSITLVLTDHGEGHAAAGHALRFAAHQAGIASRTGEGNSYWEAVEQLAGLKQVLKEEHKLWVS